MATPHKHGILHRERKLVGTAEHTGNFSTLVSAIRTAGLESALDGAGPFTIFAPTDAAFRKLPAGSVEGLLNDRGRLTSFLKGHVVPGTIMAKDSFSSKSVKTLEGGDINFDTCDEFKVNGAKVVMPDIECRNGVLHGVDGVLMPVEPPARTVAAAPASTGAKGMSNETTRAAVAPEPVREKAIEKEHVHTATCGCGQQFAAPTAAEAQGKLEAHTPKCGAAGAVKERIIEKPIAKTVAPAPAKAAASTGGKCVPKETVIKERIVERPREKTVTREAISDRPIAQCTTCGEKVVGSTAEDAEKKLIEHERIHREAAVKPKAAATKVVEKDVSSTVCSTCGEQFTGSTSEEAHRHLEEHSRVQHKGTIREALHEGAERIRGGPRESGARDYGSKNAGETVRDSGRNVSGKTGAAAAGAAGAAGAGAGAVAGGTRGLLERAGDALRGNSGQYSVRCPECGEEISGATREEAQANLTEHGKVHLR